MISFCLQSSLDISCRIRIRCCSMAASKEQLNVFNKTAYFYDIIKADKMNFTKLELNN